MIEQNIFTIVFGLFVVLTCRDMFIGHQGHDTSQDPATSNVADPHLYHTDLPNTPAARGPGASAHVASFHGPPKIKIQYCHSCGYRQAFEEVSKMLIATYPDVKVEGEIHKPNWLRSQVHNLIYFSKIAILIMLYLDVNPFTYLQMDTPRLWTHMTQSKIYSSFIIVFLSNSIESNLMSTGAFEIFYNDVPVWSKIETGRMPSMPELVTMIDNLYKVGQPNKMGQLMSPS